YIQISSLPGSEPLTIFTSKLSQNSLVASESDELLACHKIGICGTRMRLLILRQSSIHDFTPAKLFPVLADTRAHRAMQFAASGSGASGLTRVVRELSGRIVHEDKVKNP